MRIFLLLKQYGRPIFWFFLVFITYKFLAPMKHSGIEIPHLDKIAHIGIFFILTSLAYIAYQINNLKQILIWGVYGIGIELLQGQSEHRSADIFDFIANMIGVTIAVYGIKSGIKKWYRYD